MEIPSAIPSKIQAIEIVEVLRRSTNICFRHLSIAIPQAADTLRVAKAVAQSPGYLPLDIGMKYGNSQRMTSRSRS
jgi:hypothetical protein